MISLRLLIFCLVTAAYVHAATSDVVRKTDDGDITGSIEQENEVAKYKSGTTQNGQTPEFGFCYDLEKLHYWGATYIERDLQNARWPQPLTLMGENIDQNQWIEIDACSRTMMAEIGTEKACGDANNDAYAVALARIIANRAKKATAMARKLPEGDNINAILFPTKTAVEDKQQFSVWNRNAKIKSGTACPERKGANGPIWRNMINLCKTAVLDDGKRIRARTPEMTDEMMYYTSGCRMHYVRICEGATKVAPEVENTKIDSTRCFEMWQPGKKDKPAQEATCMTQAKNCCSGPEVRYGKPDKNGKLPEPRTVNTDSFVPAVQQQCDSNAPNWLTNQTASQ
jgi:hypothetical protein